MSAHRHFCIVWGTWKFENWHLYRLRTHRAVRKPSVRWVMWNKVI